MSDKLVQLVRRKPLLLLSRRDLESKKLFYHGLVHYAARHSVGFGNDSQEMLFLFSRALEIGYEGVTHEERFNEQIYYLARKWLEIFMRLLPKALREGNDATVNDCEIHIGACQLIVDYYKGATA